MKVSRQCGFSVVELMVAVALSMVLMAGVLSIFFSSKVAYFTNEKTSRLQENGRIALDLVTRDIRSAGYPGCSRQPPISLLTNASTSVLWNYSQPLFGSESNGSGSLSPALGVVLNPAPVNDSDVIVVRMALRDGQALSTQADLAAPTDALIVPDSTPAPVVAGQILMVTDCNASTIFQVSGYTPATGAIAHAASGTPGNATDDLGYLYQAPARVIPLQTVIYWVAPDPGNGNEPTLYRQMGLQAAEPLIAGIQALQIAYGQDTNNDRVADSYVSANSVGTNWDNIVSVSIAMLVRSDESGTDRDNRSYALLSPTLAPALGGKTIPAANDRRQRMIFTTTVAVRNRAL